MDIGVTPELEDKPKAISKFLYYIEFTCYSTKCRQFLFLENSKKIKPTLFELTACHTLIVHFCAEFEQVFPSDNFIVNDSDIHVITYTMYNEYYTFYSIQSDEKKAWGDCKNKTSIHSELVDITRYRLIRQERNAFLQPYKLNTLNYNSYLNLIKNYNL